MTDSLDDVTEKILAKAVEDARRADAFRKFPAMDLDDHIKRQNEDIRRLATAASVNPSDIVFAAEVESQVQTIIRQIRDKSESQARAVLKAAYDAGFDDAAESYGRCCGCSGGDPDFDGFIERLLKAADDA